MAKSSVKQATPVLPEGDNQIDLYITWFLAFGIGIIPLILRMQVINFVSPRLVDPILNTGMHTNIFTYYKWCFLIIAAVIVTLLVLLKTVSRQYQIGKYYINIPLLLLVIMLVLSAAGAEYKSIALYGTYDRWEGTVSTVGYLLLFFAAANLIIKKNYLKYINYGLVLLVGVNFILAMLKYYGFNTLDTAFMHALIIPSSFKDAAMSGGIGSTFENANYISGLFGPLMAFFLVMLFTVEGIKPKFSYLALSAATFAITLSSLSSSGFVAMFIVLLLFAVYLVVVSSQRIQLLKIYTATLVCLGLVFTLMYIRHPEIYGDTFGTLGSIAKYVTSSKDDTIKKPPATETQKITDTKSNADVGSDVSSGRFFIWSRTIKMIGDDPILGHGAGTLAYYFPQNDPEKVKYLHQGNIFVNKSHCYYIDVAFGYGIPALLFMLALFILHIYRSILTISHDPGDQFKPWRLALLAFFLAYLLQWLFNDATIGSSIVFWVLFGLAVSLNTLPLPAPQPAVKSR